MKKALMLSNSSLYKKGGIQTYRRYLVDILLNDQYSIDFMYRDNLEEKNLKNIDFINIEKKYKLPKFLNIIFNGLKLIKEKYDIILITHINYVIFAPLLRLIFKKNIILFIYGIDVQKLSFIKKYSCFFCKKIISHSNFTKLEFLNNFKTFNKLIIPIGGPYESKNITRDNKNKDGVINISSVTRIEKSDSYKNIHEIIKALIILKKKDINFIYNLVGDGDDLDSIRNIIDKYGLTKNVKIYGWVSEEKKEEILTKTDYYFLPSDGEGFGLSFIEAASYGATVLGSITDGSREALAYGKFGFLIDPKDGDLALKIANLIIEEKKINIDQTDLQNCYGLDVFTKKIKYCIEKVNNENINIFRFDNTKNRIQSVNNVSEGMAYMLYWNTKYNVKFIHQKTSKNSLINCYLKYIHTFIKVFLQNFYKKKITIFTDQGLSIYKSVLLGKKILLCHDILNQLIIKNKISVKHKIKYQFIYKLILESLKNDKIIFSSLSTKNNLQDLGVKNKITYLIYPIYHLKFEEIIYPKNILSNKFNFSNKYKYITIITSNTWYKRDDQLIDIINSIKLNDVFFNIISLNKSNYINELESKKNVSVFYGITDFDKNYILSKSNYLIFNSDYEGFGLPILEALKYNIIVFCKDKQHYRDIYENGIIYFSKNNLNIIANNIESLSDDMTKYKSHRIKSFETYNKVNEVFDKNFNALLKNEIQ